MLRLIPKLGAEASLNCAPPEQEMVVTDGTRRQQRLALLQSTASDLCVFGGQSEEAKYGRPRECHSGFAAQDHRMTKILQGFAAAPGQSVQISSKSQGLGLKSP